MATEAKPLPRAESCGNCRNWEKVVNPQDLRAKQGACHLHPPVPVVFLTPQGSALTSAWPTTDNDTWCAQFKPREIQ